MPLPEEEKLFALHIDGSGSSWRVRGVVGPFAHVIPDGHPVPVMCPLHLSDAEFSSREEALDFAKEVHDALVERGKQPEVSTYHLLESRLS